MKNIEFFRRTVFGLLLIIGFCIGWGQDGHKIISQLAWNRCTLLEYLPKIWLYKMA